MNNFKAYIVHEDAEGKYSGKICERSFDELPEGNVLIKVQYSSLNYKDVLSATGNKGVTRKYPHVPGIDAAGVVAQSNCDDFKAGDHVIVTGYDLGMNTDGGYQQFIRVPAEWVVRMPVNMNAYEAMSYGTAGFTAAQCVEKLSRVVRPKDGPVLVSGATGGVGSFAVAILHKLGYRVMAITGKSDAEAYLRFLGATEVVGRSDWEGHTREAMLKSNIAGGVDTVGGATLENMIKSVQIHGAVTCCGMISSPDISLTVFPFILRGVTLFGITSQNTRMPERLELWHKLSGEYGVPQLTAMVTEISLEELPDYIAKMKEGKVTGRVLVNLWK